MGQVTKRFDVVAGRRYSKRDGSEAMHWVNCGEAAQWDDGGISIRMYAQPVGNWFDGQLKLFERKTKDQREAPRQSGGDDFEDSSIPF